MKLTIFSAILVLSLDLPSPSFALPPVHKLPILNATFPHNAFPEFPPPYDSQPHDVLTSLNLRNLSIPNPPRPAHQPHSYHLASQSSGPLPTGPTGYLWTTYCVPLSAGITERHYRLAYRARPALHSVEIRQLVNPSNWKSFYLTKTVYPPWQESVGHVDFQVIRTLERGYLQAVVWLEALPSGIRGVTDAEVDWFQLLN